MTEAFLSAKRLQMILIRSYNRWYYYLLIILVNGFLINPLFESFVYPVKAFKLPADSMAPTLVTGDRIIVDKKHYIKKRPERLDIVIFSVPNDPTKDLIKRIVGLPGDKVEIKGNRLLLNTKLLPEPYILDDVEGKDFHSYKFESVLVPEGKLFVLGDNRANSFDSRSFGFVDVESLKGKALYIYWAKDKSRIGKEIT
jgi:signal peptidase I